MKATFFKGIVLGCVVSLGTLSATAAFAGSGAGAIFNLGRYNGVNGTTKLGGSTAGRQLDVTNASNSAGATGIGITVHSGKPPLAVNSSTKVSNLNADQLDGNDSGAFQRRVTGQCANRTTMSGVNADGSVSCSSTAIYPIYNVFGSISTTQAIDGFGASGLDLVAECYDPSIVDVSFKNVGAQTGTLNWGYGAGGGGLIVNDQAVASGGSIGFGQPAHHLEGRFIWTSSTIQLPFVTRYVVTVDVHESNSGTGCVYTGTAELTTIISRS